MCKTNNLSPKRKLPADKPLKDIKVNFTAVRKIMGPNFKIYLESRKDIHESIG
jgi:hypothetical protein